MLCRKYILVILKCENNIELDCEYVVQFGMKRMKPK